MAASFQLMSLPDELITTVLSACAWDTDTNGSLGPTATGRLAIFNFSLTCRRANRLSESALFSSILLRTVHQVEALKQALALNDRNLHVRHLALVPLGITSKNPKGIEISLEILPHLSNLEHFHLELPSSQLYDWDDEEEEISPFWETFKTTLNQSILNDLEQSKIPPWWERLKSCHLNLQGPHGKCIGLGALVNVFAAPRLTHLELVNADLRGFRPNQKFLKTRASMVTSLRLNYCWIDRESAQHLLLLPRALKAFHYNPRPNGSGDDPDASLFDMMFGLTQALMHQRRTLTDLHMGFQSRVFQSSSTLSELEGTVKKISFSELEALRTFSLQLSGYCLRPLRKLYSRLPQGITRLQIQTELDTNLSNYYLDFANKFLDRKSLFPKLRTLDLVIGHIDRTKLTEELRSNLEFVGFHLQRQRRIRSRVFRLTPQKLGRIPPYPWDYCRPEKVLAFDSNVMETQRLWDNMSQEEEIDKEVAEKAKELKAERELEKAASKETGAPKPGPSKVQAENTAIDPKLVFEWFDPDVSFKAWDNDVMDWSAPKPQSDLSKQNVLFAEDNAAHDAIMANMIANDMKSDATAGAVGMDLSMAATDSPANGFNFGTMDASNEKEANHAMEVSTMAQFDAMDVGDSSDQNKSVSGGCKCC